MVNYSQRSGVSLARSSPPARLPRRDLVRADRPGSRAVTSYAPTVYHLDCECHTRHMPTARPRHQVTETPIVARAIDLAAKRWPGESRSKLLLRLVAVAGLALEHDQDVDAERHQAAVMASSGKYAGAFGPDYLTELREDWPA